MHKSIYTGIGAVVTATFASFCCVGPLAITVLGMAGLGRTGLALTLFEPYRPYLIGLTVLLLGLGFYITCRKPAACQEHDTCAASRSRSMQKAGLCIVTGLTGLMVAVPYLPLTANPSVSDTDPGTKVVYLSVSGMT